MPALNLHQIRLFFTERTINLGDVLIGDFLNLILKAMLIVFSDLFIFNHRLHVGKQVATNVSALSGVVT